MIKKNSAILFFVLCLFILSCTTSKVYAFQNVDQFLVLKTPKTLFDKPNKGTNTKKLIEPQIIKAKKMQNQWFAIETKYGEKWITDSTVITNLKILNVDKTYILEANKVAVSIPFFINKRISIPKGTILKVSQEANDFSLVTYNNKRYWIKTDHTLKPIEHSVKNINKKLIFNTKKVLFSLPSQHSNTKQQVDIQLLTSRKQFNNWYEVETRYGKRWVTNSSVEEYEPNKTDKGKGLFLTKPRVGYHIPSLLSKRTAIPKESEVIINERWNDWISVNYKGMIYYLNSPSHETNLVPANQQSAEDANKKELLFKTDNELYKYPSTLYGTGKFTNKKIVTATHQWKTWYLIMNDDEAFWVNKNNIIEDFKPVDIEKTYKLAANKQVFIAPLHDAEQISIDSETEVKALRKWNEWIEIEYHGFKYWILEF